MVQFHSKIRTVSINKMHPFFNMMNWITVEIYMRSQPRLKNALFSDVGDFATVTRTSFLDVDIFCHDDTTEIEATGTNTTTNTTGYSESNTSQANEAYIVLENSLNQKKLGIFRIVLIASLLVPLCFGGFGSAGV